MIKKFNLDGPWELTYADHERFIADNPKINTIQAVKNAGYETIPAEVPGNFALDLMRAGKLPDLYFGTNTLFAQNIECIHTLYYREF